MAETAETPQRHLSLDVLRGIAVMGILAMNITGFALPDGDYSAPAGPMSDGAADRLSWLIAYLFFDGKMMGLFTLLFGASAMLMMERVEQADGRVAVRHYSRMIWLLIFGLIHLLLIWDGDILVYYALCGLFLYFARNARAYQLFVAGLLLLAATYFLMLGATLEVLSIAAEGGERAAGLSHDLSADFGYDRAEYARQLAVYRGSYADIVAYRWSEFSIYMLNTIELVPRLLGAMLIGAGLYRCGFLSGAMRAGQYMVIAGVAILSALVAQGLLAFWAFAAGFSPAAMFAISYGLPGAFQLSMAVGYAALIVWSVKTLGQGRGWLRLPAQVGRMSFTNYIGTSCVMTAIFYGYGLSLYGELNRAALWPFVAGGWFVMLLGSALWLKYFRQGPLEWLWRRLSCQMATG